MDLFSMKREKTLYRGGENNCQKGGIGEVTKKRRRKTTPNRIRKRNSDSTLKRLA